MNKKSESIEWDSEKRAVVITTQTYVSIDDSESLDDVKKKLKGQLKKIIDQVKGLKSEAESIKSMLAALNQSDNKGVDV